MNLLCNIPRDYTVQDSIQKYLKATDYVLVIRTAELPCKENHINAFAIDNLLYQQKFLESSWIFQSIGKLREESIDEISKF